MSTFTTTAIIVSRLTYGDYDLIVRMFSRERGIIATIAKGAKKSKRRFAGMLEPFALVRAVCRSGKGLPLLIEVDLREPLDGIRADVLKTAYASYWTQTADKFVEEGQPQPRLFKLLLYVLRQLHAQTAPVRLLSVFYQIRFLNQVGLGPNLDQCQQCRLSVDRIAATAFYFDIAQGGIICPDCRTGARGRQSISRGTLKQLQWLAQKDPHTATRMRLSPQALEEGQQLLEAFVPYHLGKVPQSLKFLREVRAQKWKA